MIENRRIADTDIEVSILCLGTMTFGRPVGEADAVRLVHWSVDHGINFIDTADMYEGYDRFMGSPGGVGELILGKAIRGRRDSVVITTKVGNSSIGFRYRFSVGERECFDAKMTVCCVEMDTIKTIPIPEDLRPGLEAVLESDA